MKNTTVWVVAHLYDNYGDFLISPVSKADCEKYNFYESCQYKTQELAERYVTCKLEKMDSLDKKAYLCGYKIPGKFSRNKSSQFLRKVFQDALKEKKYTGWLEIG